MQCHLGADVRQLLKQNVGTHTNNNLYWNGVAGLWKWILAPRCYEMNIVNEIVMFEKIFLLINIT